jgi:hypothetical protein
VAVLVTPPLSPTVGAKVSSVGLLGVCHG